MKLAGARRDLERLAHRQQMRLPHYVLEPLRPHELGQGRLRTRRWKQVLGGLRADSGHA
jgi:hypothetical protein